MKLLPVLVLAALPFYCYAGSGCTRVSQLIKDVIDPEVNKDQYIENFREYIWDADAENAVRQVKQCFLEQNKETLKNSQVMVDAVYNSVWCKPY